jgi:EAL domain-containing protein (putative c-di-GMP-specific phosphodiesterase class I)
VGFSSLDYLRRLAFDKVKIDRSFVTETDDQGRSLVLIRAIVDLGRAFGMIVTAEGVETERQLATVRDAGCDEAQGYLFSPPLAADDINRLIAQWDQERVESRYAS